MSARESAMKRTDWAARHLEQSRRSGCSAVMAQLRAGSVSNDVLHSHIDPSARCSRKGRRMQEFSITQSRIESLSYVCEPTVSNNIVRTVAATLLNHVKEGPAAASTRRARQPQETQASVFAAGTRARRLPSKKIGKPLALFCQRRRLSLLVELQQGNRLSLHVVRNTFCAVLK